MGNNITKQSKYGSTPDEKSKESPTHWGKRALNRKPDWGLLEAKMITQKKRGKVKNIRSVW